MPQTDEASAKVIYLGACLIAAVRLAREEKWDNNTPRCGPDWGCYQFGATDLSAG